MSENHLWMLTGGRGLGKTKFCRLLAGHARGAGWDVAGVLSPAVFKEGIKTGILVEDLRTGSTRPLASASPMPPFSLNLGNWYFDRGALEWGSRLLESCLPCDLFIVDELGPLELLHGEGWSAALEALSSPGIRLGLAVIRPELQEAAERLLPIHGVIQLDPALELEEQAKKWWERLSSE